MRALLTVHILSLGMVLVLYSRVSSKHAQASVYIHYGSWPGSTRRNVPAVSQLSLGTSSWPRLCLVNHLDQ